MSFTVDNILERVNSNEVGKVIAYIRDFYMEAAKRKALKPAVVKKDITTNVIRYELPNDAVISKVSTLYESNSSELLNSDDQTIETTTNWTNTDFASFSVASGTLDVTADTANQSCYLDDDGITSGLQYNLRYDVTISSGTFRLLTYDNDYILGTFDSGTNKVMTFVAPESSKLKIVCVSDTGTASFDNFSLKQAALDKYKSIGYLKGDMPADYFDDEEY